MAGIRLSKLEVQPVTARFARSSADRVVTSALGHRRMHLERRSQGHVRIHDWHVAGESRNRRIGRSAEHIRPRLRHVAVAHAIADAELRRVWRDNKTLSVEGMAGRRDEGFATPVKRLENVELSANWRSVLVKLSVVAVVHVLAL